MIRDPSDGSVRKKPELDFSGLAPVETDEQRNYRMRLEASREWLREYHNGRAGAMVDRAD